MDLKEAILSHFQNDFSYAYKQLLPGREFVRAGPGFLALCPFHDDRTPSLSIAPATGLFKCFGCGAVGDFFVFYARLRRLDGNFPAVLRAICDEFGIAASGPNPAPRPAPEPQPVASPRGRIAAVYDYRGADGRLLYQVLRLEPKSFRQRRPDGKGGWVWNLDGVERVLYRLPDISAADEVWLVEGEKDADALASLGFHATTAPGGAGKWLDQYTEALAGKLVFILPDNDPPGREHARKVGQALFGKAREVRIVELPGLPEKGDASDFIAACANPEEAAERLRTLAAAAPGFAPEPEPKIEAAEPTKPKAPEPAAFPEWVMAGPAGDFANLYSSHLEPPPAFFYFSFLACLGSIVASRLTLEAEIRAPARLFVLLLGESADDRKSTAIDKTVSFFSEAVEGFAVCRGVGSAEGLQMLFAAKPRLLLCLDEFRHLSLIHI